MQMDDVCIQNWTLSPVCVYTLGNVDGKEKCNKISLMLFINSLSTSFRKGYIVFSFSFFFFLNGMAFM